MTRHECLRKLIGYEIPLDLARDLLKSFPWDGDVEVVMTTSDVTSILKNFLGGKISSSEIARWADLIECREDIDLEEANNDKILRFLLEIANPEINGQLSLERATYWIDHLSG
jgi:Ca2+-binding EF-hand superfamily protein